MMVRRFFIHFINVVGGASVLFSPSNLELRITGAPHQCLHMWSSSSVYFLFFGKKESHHSFKLFTVGSRCSNYPSSTRQGLVIFHEHIADLLSGGVSLFSIQSVDQKTNVIFLLIEGSHSAGLPGADLSFLRLLQSRQNQLSEHHLQPGAGVSPGYCSLSVPQSHLDREKVAGMAKPWEWYRFTNQRLIRVILQGRPWDSNVTWFRMQIAFRAFATRSLPAGISASPTRTPRSWREAVCFMSSR